MAHTEQRLRFEFLNQAARDLEYACRCAPCCLRYCVTEWGGTVKFIKDQDPGSGSLVQGFIYIRGAYITEPGIEAYLSTFNELWVEPRFVMERLMSDLMPMVVYGSLTVELAALQRVWEGRWAGLGRPTIVESQQTDPAMRVLQTPEAP